jgi:hypothetical protein
VGLERGPLSLVSTTEELLGRKIIGYSIEIREYGLRVPHCLDNRLEDGGEVLSLTRRPRLTPEVHSGANFC